MRRSRLAGLLAAGVAVAVPAASFAAGPLLEAAAPPRVAGAALVGRLAANTPMQVSVSLPLRDPAGLHEFLAALYDPANPQYRHYLTPVQFADRFGVAADTFAQAAAFFRAQGLDVRDDAANRDLLQLSGRADQIEAVFHVTLSQFRHPDGNRLFFAADRAPSTDAPVALLDVIGLDDAVAPSPRLIKPAAVPMGIRATGSGPNGYFIGSDMRVAYYGKGSLTGAGQSLGLMELAGYNLASVQTYFSKVGQPLNVPVVGVQTDSHSLSCTGRCSDDEQALDIEYAISMAPGLRQLQVYVGNNAEDVLNRMVSDDSSPELSTSWGWNEKFSTDDNLFLEMAAQGQTMLTASGDYSSLAASGPWPEEDANLTAVGGTDLVTNGAGGAWSSETGWKSSAGGPSTDATIKIVSYQKPYVTIANKASATVRNVPDIAASANTNMYYCANSGCGAAGGTSFASPIWAGFVALANQQALASGHGLTGFLNPTLYGVGHAANVGTLLHDVTKGTSGKYTATTSYDLVTGLGTPKLGLITTLATAH